jgi:hypothetical protein
MPVRHREGDEDQEQRKDDQVGEEFSHQTRSQSIATGVGIACAKAQASL